MQLLNNIVKNNSPIL